MAKTTVESKLFLPNPMEVPNHNNKHNSYSNHDFPFPSEFPYDFKLSSPNSPPCSTETESSDEEEEFLAGLTRRLCLTQTKTRDSAGSPQSILSGIGSWSGRSTVSGDGDGTPKGLSRVPPERVSFVDPYWEVIRAAAGEVARLKIQNNQNRHVGPTCSNIFSNRVETHQRTTCSVWGREAKPNWLVQQQQRLQIQNRVREFGYKNGKLYNGPLSFPQSASYPVMQNQRVHFGGSGSRVIVPGSGSSVKRRCGGTGVFLPRHYETTSPSDSRNKTGCAPVMLPAKPVNALNSSINVQNVPSQPRFSNAFATNYDALLARRNALVTQQRLNARREEATNYEIRLPQEWTY